MSYSIHLLNEFVSFNLILKEVISLEQKYIPFIQINFLDFCGDYKSIVSLFKILS